MILEEIIKDSIPIVIGIRDMKYVPILTLPDSPSISGSFNPNKPKKKIIPKRINNAPAMFKDIFNKFIKGFQGFFLSAFFFGLGLPFTDAAIMLWNMLEDSFADFLLAFAIKLLWVIII